MIISGTTNLSPTRTFDFVDAEPEAFTAVELTANGVQTAGASSVPVGIYNGGDVNICGGTFWAVGGTSICAGDLLSSDANGRAVAAASGNFAFAVALENASASGVAQVQIINGGFVR